MHTVLLQKQGEVTAALLPQWISGYAFAFPAAPDLARARALANALPPAARALTLSYDPAMRAARSLAERVAVNARDAGLAVQVSPQNPRADVRLVEMRLARSTRRSALAGLAAALGLEAPAAPAASSPRRSTKPSASCWKASARSRSFSFPFSTAWPAACACMRRRRLRAWAIGASTTSGSPGPRHDLSHAAADRLRAHRGGRRGVRGRHRLHHHPARVFERSDEQRVAALAAQFRQEYLRRQREIAQQVKDIADADSTRDMVIALSRPDADPSAYVDAAQPLAAAHNLDFLELVSANGSIVSSAQWPARFLYQEDWVTAARRLELAASRS